MPSNNIKSMTAADGANTNKAHFPVSHVQLHSPFTWPGVPQMLGETLNDTKIKGLKMVSGPKGIQCNVGNHWGVIPMCPHAKFTVTDGPVYND